MLQFYNHELNYLCAIMSRIIGIIFILGLFAINLNGQSDFLDNYKTLLDQYYINDRIDYENIRPDLIDNTSKAIEDTELSSLPSSEQVAYLINIYNFLVIKKIKERYPITSVAAIPDFFTKEIFQGLSLNQLEKRICTEYGNPYLHFLLNCGAKGCPPLPFVTSQNMDELIGDALQKDHIVQIKKSKQEVLLSKIFYWNAKDFGPDQEIKKHLSEILLISDLADYNIDYLDYDWSINGLTGDDILLFYPTKLYGKGGGEVKIFNNYYTQSDNGLRSNFFSSFIQVLIGTDKNLNFGFDLKLRSVDQGKDGLFSALSFSTDSFSENDGVQSFARAGISALGPRIRYEPFKDKPNINFLHAIYFVPMSDAQGNDDYGYADFGHLQIFNNAFIEKELSLKRRLFFDIGAHIENVRFGIPSGENHFMQLQFPVTMIYSYIPSTQWTYYGLANAALKPVFNYNGNAITNTDISGYAQLGAGVKYYVFDFLELEAVYTYFFDTTPGRQAHTFNLGMRLFRF